MAMDFSKLLSQIDSVTTTKKNYDEKENYWKLTKDKAGNATAIIRFLPNKDTEDFPFVRMFSHSFKNIVGTQTRYYIEKSLSTIGGQDKIGEVNRELWNSGLDENKKQAGVQKRKLQYISNILVIKDTLSPENEGKVFKFSYGMKIWDKIVAAAKPDADLGEDPVNAFDPENGADFLLKQTIVAEWPNFDSSKFSATKPLAGGDKKEMKRILSECHDLNLEVAPEKFKTPKELEDKFNWVMGLDKPKAKSVASKEVDDELDSLKELAKEDHKPVKKPVALPVMDDTDDDDSAAFFKSLIED